MQLMSIRAWSFIADDRAVSVVDRHEVCEAGERRSVLSNTRGLQVSTPGRL
jgi:hypothetical protein